MISLNFKIRERMKPIKKLTCSNYFFLPPMTPANIFPNKLAPNVPNNMPQHLPAFSFNC